MRCRTLVISLLALPFITLVITGCGFNTSPVVAINVPSAALSGTARGGQQPVVGATVSIYAVGTSGYGSAGILLASTTTDSSGNFQFAANAYTCPQDNTPTYLLASGGNPGLSGNFTNPALVLASSVGLCIAAKKLTGINVDETSTVRTALAMGQFFNPNPGSTPTSDSFGAFSTTAPANGIITYSQGITNAIEGDPIDYSTDPLDVAKIYTMANILAACVNSAGPSNNPAMPNTCDDLFAYTTQPGGYVPTDTLQAAVQMALHPTRNVSALFALASAKAPFVGLPTPPSDWTVAPSSDLNYGNTHTRWNYHLTVTNGTVTNLDINTYGTVLFPTVATVYSFDNGSYTTEPGLGELDEPGPSILSIPNLVNPQNVAIDDTQIEWVGDAVSGAFGAYGIQPAPTGAPSSGNTVLTVDPSNRIYVAYLTGTGSAAVPTLGLVSADYTTYSPVASLFHAASAIISDPAGNIYMATSDSSGNGYTEKFTPSTGVISIVGTYPAAGIGQLVWTDGYIIQTSPALNTVCLNVPNACLPSSALSLSSPQGIAVDGDGQIWIANSGNRSVTVLPRVSVLASAVSTPPSTPLGTTYSHQYMSNTSSAVSVPYGIAIDASGNVYTSNAACPSSPSSPCTYDMTMNTLIGVAAPTITPLAWQIRNGVNLIGTRPTY